MANWIGAYSLGVEELKKMEKCMQGSQDLGRAMVAMSRMNFKYPAELMGRAVAYGTHTK